MLLLRSQRYAPDGSARTLAEPGKRRLQIGRQGRYKLDPLAAGWQSESQAMRVEKLACQSERRPWALWTVQRIAKDGPVA